MQAATDYKKELGARSKHIDTRTFKLKEFVEDKILRLCTVNSSDNLADCMTKSLPRDSVEYARHFMLGNVEVG